MKRHAAPKKFLLKRPAFWIGLILIVALGSAAVAHEMLARLADRKTIVKTISKPKPKPVKLTADEKKVAKKYYLSSRVTAKAHAAKVTAIGDSVMVDIKPEIKQVFPHVLINGAVGRQFYELPNITQSLKAENKLADNVVVNLGTNGPPEKTDISRFLKVVGSKRQVYWINTHVPSQKWEGKTNRLIAATAKSHRNVHVVDWHDYSEGQTNFFASDGVHLQTNGAIAYVALLAKTMAEKNTKKNAE